MTLEQHLMFAAPFVQASLERSPCGSSLKEVFADIVEGRAHLWTGENSALVTQFVPTQSIWHAGGEMADLIGTVQRAWPIMQANGATTLSISNTRKGWSRVLKEHGFVEENVLVLEG